MLHVLLRVALARQGRKSSEPRTRELEPLSAPLVVLSPKELQVAEPVGPVAQILPVILTDSGRWLPLEGVLRVSSTA